MTQEQGVLVFPADFVVPSHFMGRWAHTMLYMSNLVAATHLAMRIEPTLIEVDHALLEAGLDRFEKKYKDADLLARNTEFMFATEGEDTLRLQQLFIALHARHVGAIWGDFPTEKLFIKKHASAK
ncbi:MAG: hypothetical protein ABIA47_00900 [bacterium]